MAIIQSSKLVEGILEEEMEKIGGSGVVMGGRRGVTGVGRGVAAFFLVISSLCSRAVTRACRAMMVCMSFILTFVCSFICLLVGLFICSFVRCSVLRSFKSL